ncbi:MAG: efflux RND transporter periplasmic adaptor subunit [Sphingomonadales bacterium]|nr:efflux RND transporter periplasmic adaptor subunit [Sphingomonadales bacterium]
MKHNFGSRHACAALFVATVVLAGCNKEDPSAAKRPPEVGFRVMGFGSAPFAVELPGRITAYRTAEVRPQATGVIQARLFTEGALVRQGQPLYRIDASLYRAAAGQAAANLAAAQASAAAAQAKADRYRPLAAANAVSQQDYTDAAALARTAAAAVAQTRAALQTAQVNLRFATVPAPITGRIGRSLVTEGGLATASQATPLAVISVLDPVYVDIQQSASEMMRLRRRLGGSGAAASVRLKLDDGSDYPLPGALAFSEVTVTPGTGTVTLRARFPNPQGLLLPGMFARAELALGKEDNVFLVPQGAVSRDPRGNATVLLVGPDGKAVMRAIEAERTQGADWVVTDGLKPGDRVITQGLGKAKPRQPVRAVPETAPQKPRTGKPGADAKAAG